MTDVRSSPRSERRSLNWWEPYDEPAREVVRRLFRLGAVDTVNVVRQASRFEDTRQVTDAVLEVPAQQVRMAFRVRKASVGFRDFTIRSEVPYGGPTELDKLRMGGPDSHFYLYAWVDTSTAVPVIDEWWFIDLNKARAAGLFSDGRQQTRNFDGTAFVVIRYDELVDASAIIHTHRTLPAASVTRRPYYQDDLVTLWLGDCRQVDDWVRADVLVTDPPYGMAYQSNSAKGGPSDAIAGDCDPTLRDEVLGRWGDRPALVFGTWRVPRPPGVRQLVVWDKGASPGMGDLSVPWGPAHEEVYVLGTGFRGTRKANVLHFDTLPPSSGERPNHPTPKPLGLMRDLIAYCPPGVIADPFAGSGSTLRAAKDLGRTSVGVEVDERYCELAAKRLCQEALDLFGETA